MKELPYVVECKAGNFFEPIAAFNSEGVAHYYARNCQTTNPRFTYRVVTVKA